MDVSRAHEETSIRHHAGGVQGVRLGGKLYFSLVLLIAAVLAMDPVAAQDKPTPVKDLSYGNALFNFYSGDYFTSATNLLVARKQETLTHHQDDAELLLGGLYLSYGQQDEASKIFASLLDTTKPAVRDRAWLYLAEIAWQRGNTQRANDALASMGNALEKEFVARQQLLKARLAIDAQDFDQAINVLGDWQGGKDLAAFAAFNLGVAMIRHGEADGGAKQLQRVGQGRVRTHGKPSRWKWAERLKFWKSSESEHDSDEQEWRALKDKANLALGFAFLQQKEAHRALEHLSRVSSGSALSNKARLGAGWAATELGQFELALSHWADLKNGDRLDPAVQEALLAIPFANRRLGNGDQAVAEYEEAIEHFNDEVAYVEEVKQSINHGEFLTDLLADDEAETVGWFWRLKQVPNSTESRYLYHLVASHSFQEGLKNYRDLQFLRNNLLDWQASLASYRDMLNAQKARFSAQLSATPQAEQDDRLSALSERLREAQSAFQRIQETQDFVGLASSEERAIWQRLQGIGLRLSQIDTPRANGAKDKHRVLQGLMHWDLMQEYPQRAWDKTKQLNELQEQLAKAQKSRASLSETSLNSPERFAAFAARIDALEPRIATMLQRVDTSLGVHQSYLAELAGEQFDRHAKRLTAYLTEAQFALASAYDQVARAEDAP